MKDSTSPKAGAMPSASQERLLVLDVLRGIALFGILVVNLFDFQLARLLNFGFRDVSDGLDYWLATGVLLFFEGKFYPIFSLLFGLGFALQILRLEARGVSPIGVMVRRLLALMGFGICHAVFIWRGDILLPYALVGFGLLFLHKLAPRTLLMVIGAIWLSLVMSCSLCCGGIGALLIGTDATEMGSVVQSIQEEGERELEAYQQASYWAVMPQRLRDWGLVLLMMILFSPQILMLFLLGLYFGKVGLFADPSAHRRVLVLMVALLPIGLLASGVYTQQIWSFSREMNFASFFLVFAVMPLMWFQSLGYIGLFLLAWERLGLLRRVLAWLAFPGRMALTNYLLQSVVCTLVFYGYGLGLAGKVSVSGGLAFCVGLYLAQVGFSTIWLRYFQFGPMEWLWRVLTYGRILPMRKMERGIILSENAQTTDQGN